MKFLEKVNVLYGLFATFAAAIFGKYWFLFAGFLICNVIDFITGWVKSKFYTHTESSAVGAKGILKKVFYWLVIGLAFFISHSFQHMGEVMGINLSFVILFGWFTLATYLINEIRSILENLVEMNVEVPAWLVKGLAVTKKLIDNKANAEVDSADAQEINKEKESGDADVG